MRWRQVLTDVKEVLALLTLLLCFALMSSGYVLHKGLKEGKRSQYELVLRCVLILTSVVPPELPMQTAVAVNTALFALFKASVFCTEPFRIPFAGKVEFALFDKTGTLTTDQLVAVGTWNGEEEIARGSEVAPMSKANKEACVVLGACQALVKLNDKVVGDPIEMAAISAIGWEYDPTTQRVQPGPKSVCCSEGELSVNILFRYHFSSRLQRMAVVASLRERSGKTESLALVKGSPEALKVLLHTVPPGYDATYRALAEDGMRVLALAMRKLNGEEAEVANRAAHTGKGPAREEIEKGLTFVGFVAFSCLVRRDTAEIIAELKRSSHNVAMATGDAALTALYVGRQVGITGKDKGKALLLTKTDGGLAWLPVQDDASHGGGIKYDSAKVESLVRSGHDLCVTGPTLQVLHCCCCLCCCCYCASTST
jgi:cation-transporting ATPase 13A1